jgi:hypothetical protein
MGKTTMEIESERDAIIEKNEHEYAEENKCTTPGVVVFAIGLVSGTFSAVLGKMV